MQCLYIYREALKERGISLVEPDAILANRLPNGRAVSIHADIYKNAEGVLLGNVFTYDHEGGHYGSVRPQEGVDRSEDMLILAECRRDYGYDENGRVYHFKQVMR